LTKAAKASSRMSRESGESALFWDQEKNCAQWLVHQIKFSSRGPEVVLRPKAGFSRVEFHTFLSPKRSSNFARESGLKTTPKTLANIFIIFLRA
jgi:hypothetical protein